jgi:5-methylcytosine-specific restriction protein A
MPTAAPRICARCGRLTPAGKRCACRPGFEGSANPASTRRWRKLRAAKLRANPICEADGCRHVATEVDHRTPIAEGGERFSFENMTSYCAEHHRQKSIADALRGKQRPR